MKKKLLFLFAVLGVVLTEAEAQNYERICLVDSTSWNYIPYGACDGFYTDSICILTDTVYESVNYFVLYNHGYFENDTAGYLREDTIEGKLWYREELDEGREFLLTDLSLQKGDGFWLYLYNESDSVEIIVDTVYFDLQNRKHVNFGNERMSLCSAHPDFEFVEGVGCTAGHLYQGNTDGVLMSALLCCHKGADPVFINTEFDGLCYIIGLSVPETDMSFNASAYPNPSSGSFMIDFENIGFETFEFKLYSSGGQLIFSKQTNKDYFLVDENLPAGFFYFTLGNSRGKRYAGKIVVE